MHERENAIVSQVYPEGMHACPPVTDGEGMAVADLDFALITKRKRMMDAAGHYARPDLLRLWMDLAPRSVAVGAGDPRASSLEPAAVDHGYPDADHRAPVVRPEAG